MSIGRNATRIVALTTVLLFATSSHGQLGIKFGLDDGTQTLISQLPEQFRLQAFKLIQDSLPLIDKSVEGYLIRIDQILRKNVEDGLNAVQCTAVGLGADIKDGTNGSLAWLFFKDGPPASKLTPSNLPEPLQRLSKAISQTREEISVKTSANEIVLAYADLLQYVATVKCQTKIAALPVVREVEAQTERLFLPALEWQMLVARRDKPWCDDPRDCIIKRRSQVSVLVRDSDPRDIKFSSPQDQFDATELLKIIPPDPPAPSFLDRILTSRIPILEYEAVLASFRHVERTILAHRQRRRDDALNRLQPLTKEMNDAIGLYNNAKNNMDHPTDEPVDAGQTFERTTQIASRLTAVLVAIQKIYDDDRDVEPEYNSIKSTINESLDKNGVLRARADKVRHH